MHFVVVGGLMFNHYNVLYIHYTVSLFTLTKIFRVVLSRHSITLTLDPLPLRHIHIILQKCDQWMIPPPPLYRRHRLITPRCPKHSRHSLAEWPWCGSALEKGKRKLLNISKCFYLCVHYQDHVGTVKIPTLIPRAGDNATMFSGHKVVRYCNITIFGLATASRHWYLNIFLIFSGPWGSITFLRCRCREAVKLSRAQLC